MPIKSAHLTAEELTYLRELFTAKEHHETTPIHPRQLLLDPSGSDAELLLQLINAERLRLTVEQGN